MKTDSMMMRMYSPGDEDLQVSPHFRAGEFRPRKKWYGQRGPWLLSAGLVVKLEKLRCELGCPVKVTSGYRPPYYNAMVMGARDSVHMYGMAADIKVKGRTPIQVARAAWDTGFRRIGIAGSYVHLDVREGEAIWTYRYGRVRPATDQQVLSVRGAGR